MGSVERRSNRERKIENCRKKQRFDTEERAQHFARLRGLNYYNCDICKGYHLTSKDDSWKGVY